MRTIWVYKGTPNPPVKPSGVLNRGIVFNLRGWVATAVEPTEPILSKMVIVSLPLSDHTGESIAAVGCSTDCDCRHIDCLRSTHLWDVTGRRSSRPDSSDSLDARGDWAVRTEHQDHRRLVAVRVASRTHDGRE